VIINPNCCSVNNLLLARFKKQCSHSERGFLGFGGALAQKHAADGSRDWLGYGHISPNAADNVYLHWFRQVCRA